MSRSSSPSSPSRAVRATLRTAVLLVVASVVLAPVGTTAAAAPVAGPASGPASGHATTAGTAAASAPVTFGYADAPADTVTAALDTTYDHQFSVRTNASEGPLVLTLYHNRSAPIAYASHAVSAEGTTLSMRANTTNVTVDGRQLTRVRLVNRSVPLSGPTEVNVSVGLTMPSAATSETLYTGGTHAPTGTTLPLETTTLTATAPDLAPTALSVNRSTPTVGQNVTVNVTVSNLGGLAATDAPVEVTAGSTRLDRRNLSLGVGNSSSYSLVWQPSSAAEYTLAVEASAPGADLNGANDTRSLTVQVRSTDDDDDGGDGGDGGGGGGGGVGGALPGSGPSGEVEISDRALLNDTVRTGELVLTEVALSNFDPEKGELTLTLAADGSTLTERTVSVRASSERTVTVGMRFTSPGEYELSLNNASLGTVTVEATETPTPTATATPTSTASPSPTATSTPSGPDPGASDGSPTATASPSPSPTRGTTSGDGTGFGLVVAVVALGLGVLGARRRG